MQKYLSIGLWVAVVALGGLGVWQDRAIKSEISSLAAPSFGATNSATPAVFETYLANAEGTSDTSFTLANNALRDGTQLSGYVCLTIDSNTSTLEYECGTDSGGVVSSLLRGLDASTGTTSVPSLIFAHRRGADAKITDYPTLTIVNNQLSGIQSIGTPIFYDTSVASSTIALNLHNLVDVDLLNSITVAGAPNASLIAKGLVQLATGLQAASSTALGSTGASLVIPASVATDTPTQSTVSASKVVMSDLTGFIKQGWINLTQSFTFSGGLTSTATTTISASNVNSNAFVANLVKYAFPGSQGSANSRLTNDGSGNLSWTTGATRYAYATTTAIATTNSYATTTQFSVPIPAGLLTASSTIHVVVSLSVGQGQAGGSGTFNLRDAAGDTLSSCAAASSLSSGGQSGFCVFDIYMNNSASSQIDSTFYSLLGGAGNSSVATVGTTTFNLGSATSLFGVIISSASAVTVTLGSMVVSITP